MNRDVIVTGSSAGGITALRIVLSKLPVDLPAIIIVVQHLARESPKVLPDILSRSGPLKAAFVEDGEMPSQGRIYVAPPDRHVIIQSSGKLTLSRGPKENRVRPSVDPTFRSAALAFGARTIGIVLSGYLDDGTAGLRAVELCGGTCLVQDPNDAEAPSMPVSALQAVKARIVPLRDMASVLTSLVASKKNTTLPSDEKSRAAIKHEVEIAAGDPISLEIAPLIGKPSALTCPDCHGALFLVDTDQLLQRYRCHTGHAFTAVNLLEALHEFAENSIWASVRAMQEKAILLDHIANHTDQRNISSLTTAAHEAKAAADRLRMIAQQHERTRLSFAECDDTSREQH